MSAGATDRAPQFRTYEIYQRMRVGESTAKIKPRQLTAPEFLLDPHSVLAILRENYPCYRDWPGNAFWITRYDDVTSVLADDANYETRPRRWFYGVHDGARDLGDHLAVLTCQAERIDASALAVARRVIAEFTAGGTVDGTVGRPLDLATEFAARYPIELLAHVLDLPADDVPTFAERYWRMQRGWLWEPRAQQDGLEAMAALTDYFEPLLAARRAAPGDDLVSVIGRLHLDDGPATAADIVATLLEGDHETLHGTLANLWFLLLTHPEALAKVAAERRFVKLAWLEALRHSPPVLVARRFARHEVERFGRLLPEGALLMCAASAANRDPRVFDDPDTFLVGRKDLCQREPRGHYRADGLPTGISLGTGQPSKHPALPEDRPRSRYAITRDTAVTASNALLDAVDALRLVPGVTPTLRSLRLGEMHTCWHLPVIFTPR
jgi:pulcherriminic acid synthase